MTRRRREDPLQKIERELSHMSQQLDDLKASVANTTSVEQSALLLIQGLKAQLDAAGTDPAALADLKSQLDTEDAALAAAVAANTPGAPAPGA